jgi:hypothetical protein
MKRGTDMAITDKQPTLEEVAEALKWAEQPLDRCIEKDLPALKAFKVLAAQVAALEGKLDRAKDLSVEGVRLMEKWEKRCAALEAKLAEAEKRAGQYAGYISNSGHGLIDRAEAAEQRVKQEATRAEQWKASCTENAVKLSRAEAALLSSQADLEKERKLNDAWHQGHWKADMEAVKSYKDIAANALAQIEAMRKALNWARTIPLQEISEVLQKAGSDLYAEELERLDALLDETYSPSPSQPKPVNPSVDYLRGWSDAITAACEFCEKGYEPQFLEWDGVKRWWHTEENVYCQGNDLRKAYTAAVEAPSPAPKETT